MILFRVCASVDSHDISSDYMARFTEYSDSHIHRIYSDIDIDAINTMNRERFSESTVRVMIYKFVDCSSALSTSNDESCGC